MQSESVWRIGQWEENGSRDGKGNRTRGTGEMEVDAGGKSIKSKTKEDD
jgi:hypothetical protein